MLAFALSGGLVAIRTTRVDIVGVITLAMVTALGSILRDALFEHLPPATFTRRSLRPQRARPPKRLGVAKDPDDDDRSGLAARARLLRDLDFRSGPATTAD